MVPSSSIVVATECEHLTYSGFSLAEPVRLRNFEFIANYFSGLSLSPRRSDEGAVSVGSTHSGASTLQWGTIKGSAKGYLMASSKEGGRPPFSQMA
jgi:hypothetical protein